MVCASSSMASVPRGRSVNPAADDDKPSESEWEWEYHETETEVRVLPPEDSGETLHFTCAQ